MIFDLKTPPFFHDLFDVFQQIFLNFVHGPAFDANEMVMEMLGTFPA